MSESGIRKVTLRGYVAPMKAWAIRFPNGRQVVQVEDGMTITILNADGREFFGTKTSRDIIAEGWPMELVDGEWYRTADGLEVAFRSHPKHWQSRSTGVGEAYGKDETRWLVSEDGRAVQGGFCNLVEQLPEPPAWAKGERETRETVDGT